MANDSYQDISFDEALEQLNRELPIEDIVSITLTETALSKPHPLDVPPRRYSTAHSRVWTVRFLIDDEVRMTEGRHLRTLVTETIADLRFRRSKCSTKPAKLSAPSSAMKYGEEDRRQKDAS